LIADVLNENNVIVFMLVRQDLLRWGLSKYHGNGSNRHGQLQFRVASGEITKEELGKINVDCNRLERIINECEQIHKRKRRVVKHLKTKGIEVHPLRYEDFLTDKSSYFKNFGEKLDLKINDQEIDKALNIGGFYQKVHSNDISEFVVNHEEVLAKLGHKYFAWD
jgi:hypothetical protein